MRAVLALVCVCVLHTRERVRRRVCVVVRERGVGGVPVGVVVCGMCGCVWRGWCVRGQRVGKRCSGLEGRGVPPSPTVHAFVHAFVASV